MTITQTLNNIQENNYDDDIQITDIPKGYFPAVTANSIAPGDNTRQISVWLMPLEQSPGGTMDANPGLYVKAEDETAVKVTLTQDGKELATNTCNYN